MKRDFKKEANQHSLKFVARHRISTLAKTLVEMNKPERASWCGLLLKTLGIKKSGVPHNLFYKQFHPIIFILTVFGRTAIQKTPDGDYTWKWFSSLSIFCLLNYTCQTYLAVLVCRPRLSTIFESTEYDEVLFALNVLGYIQTHFQVPFTFWIQGPKYASYLNQWSRFENDWHRLTGEKLKLRYKGTTWAFFAAVLVIIPFVLVLEKYALLHDPYLYLLPYYIPLTCIACFVGSWYIACMEMAGISNDLLRFLLKAGRRDIAFLQNWRILWMDAGALVTNMGTHHFAILTSVFLTFSVNFLFGLYNAIVRIAKGDISVPTLGYIAASLISLLIIYLLCDSGHQVEYRKKQLVFRSKKFFCQNDQHTEINMVLKVLENECPRIHIAGFITLDRPLFISFLANTITYLIVILQFKGSSGWK